MQEHVLSKRKDITMRQIYFSQPKNKNETRSREAVGRELGYISAAQHPTHGNAQEILPIDFSETWAFRYSSHLDLLAIGPQEGN